jgi:hypothetical protein
MGKNAIQNVIRNDSLQIVATVTNPNNNNLPVPLQGWKGFCTVKAALDENDNTNDDPSATIQIIISSISDPLGTGIVTFVFTPAQTNVLPVNYVYDVEIVSPDRSTVYSSVEDNFDVIADVTRAVS